MVGEVEKRRTFSMAENRYQIVADVLALGQVYLGFGDVVVLGILGLRGYLEVCATVGGWVI
jgi:hypothetical protein